MSKVRIYAVLALVAVVLIWWLFIRSGLGGGAANAYPPTTVVAFTVEKHNIPILVTAFGSLRSTESAELSVEKPDVVTGVHFKEGEVVPKGTLLITLDDKNEKANLAKAQADQNLYQLEFDRTVILYKKGVLPLQEQDKAAANLAQRKAQVDIAQAELEKTKILAPFTAQLGARKVSVGQYVTPGQPLVSLVNRQALKVEFSVPERYLSCVKNGQGVDLTTIAFPGRHFQGVIDYISPNITPSTRSLTLEAAVENKERLLSPGLSVQVHLQLGTEENALIIPEESLVATIEGQIVYVIKDGNVIATPVEVGSRANGMVGITKGLARGEVVVSQGQQKLRDGAPVVLMKAEEQKESAPSQKEPAK